MDGSLLSLPDELLEIIAHQCALGQDDLTDCKASPSRTRDLLSLCKSSRRLWQVAEPYLYEHPGSLGSDEKTGLLFRSLSNRPSLARLIKTLHVRPTRHDPQAPLRRDEIGDFAVALSTCRPLEFDGLRIYDVLASGMEDGCVNDMLVALLALTTTAQTIHVDFRGWPGSTGSCGCCHRFQYYIHSLFGDCPNFETDAGNYPFLREIMFSGYWPWPTTRHQPTTSTSTVRMILGIFGLKSLGFSGVIDGVNAFQTAAWDTLEATSSVTKIRLDSTNVDATTLDQILRACKAVEKVEVNWKAHRPSFPHLLGREADPSRLVESLRRHTSTLTSLTLSNVMDGCRAWRFAGPLGSLKTFTHLRHLAIDEKLLLTPGELEAWRDINLDNILPPSLEHLILHSDRGMLKIGNILKILRTFRGEQLAHLEVTFSLGVPRPDANELFQMYESGSINDWIIQVVDYGETARINMSYSSPAPICMSKALRDLCESMKEADRDAQLQDQT